MTNSNPSHPHAERVEQAKDALMDAVFNYGGYFRSLAESDAACQRVIDARDALVAAVRSEGAPALEVQRQKESENDLGAELIHQIASPLVETEPRPNGCPGCGNTGLDGSHSWCSVCGGDAAVSKARSSGNTAASCG